MSDTKSILTIMNAVCNRAYNDVATTWKVANDGKPLTYNFFPGTPTEIKRRVLELTQSPEYSNKRFPLIGMVYNIKEDSGSKGVYGSAEIPIWIMHTIDKTKPNYEDQMANTIEPFLYPYWNALKTWIKRSGYFHIDITKGVEHGNVNRLNWGNYVAGVGNTENILGEKVAGLDVTLKLTLAEKTDFAVNKETRII
jgi:hypothetical protein